MTDGTSRRSILGGAAGAAAFSMLGPAVKAAAPGTEAYESARSRNNLPIPYALPMGRAFFSGGPLRLDIRESGKRRIYWHCNGAHRTYNFNQYEWDIVEGGTREGKTFLGVLYLPFVEARPVMFANAGPDESTFLDFHAGISGGANPGINIYFTDLQGNPINLKQNSGLNKVLSNSRNLWVNVTSAGGRLN